MRKYPLTPWGLRVKGELDKRGWTIIYVSTRLANEGYKVNPATISQVMTGRCVSQPLTDAVSQLLELEGYRYE
jgi:hypothetical protein